MTLELENFDEVRIRGEALYKTFEPIYCPYLEAKVHFNSEGLEHLKFKRRRVARPRQDQYMRFKLLWLAPVILSTSKTVQGIWETKEFIQVRVHNRNENVLKPIVYFEFVAVYEKIRVKVIVKRIDNSVPIFWSIIPYWGINKSNNKRKLHSGNLNED